MRQYPATPPPGVFRNHQVTAKIPPKYRFQRAYRQNLGNKDLIAPDRRKPRASGLVASVAIVLHQLLAIGGLCQGSILENCHPERSEGPAVPADEETAAPSPDPSAPEAPAPETPKARMMNQGAPAGSTTGVRTEHENWLPGLAETKRNYEDAVRQDKGDYKALDQRRAKLTSEKEALVRK